MTEAFIPVTMASILYAGRSAINRRHDPIGVTLPRDVSRRQSVVEHLRLQEARRLMLSGSMDATTAALEVGYQSPSQFSREYRRLFGLPPLQDIKAVRKSSASGAFEKS